MRLKKVTFAGAIALAIAGSALADEAQVKDAEKRESAAWAAAATIEGDVLMPTQRGTLMLLAWHATAANLCSSLVLDHERFGTAYATIEHSDAASLSDAEHEYFRHHLAVMLGVSVGIMLAEHAGTPEEVASFCEEAETFAKDATEENYFERDEATTSQ